MANPANTILLSPADQDQTVRETLANGVVTPGHLILVTATAVVHAPAAGNAAKTFALENVANALGIDDDYASGETLRYLNAKRGDGINALLKANGAAIVIGDALESEGDGTLRKVLTAAATADVSRDSIVAYAAESLDNSSNANVVRIQVEVA